MMKAVRTSEMSVNFNVTTWRYIPEDSELYTRCRENLKSHIGTFLMRHKSCNPTHYLCYVVELAVYSVQATTYYEPKLWSLL
jgi:hypothetical protein